jgi:hypothetical protein
MRMGEFALSFEKITDMIITVDRGMHTFYLWMRCCERRSKRIEEEESYNGNESSITFPLVVLYDNLTLYYVSCLHS